MKRVTRSVFKRVVKDQLDLLHSLPVKSKPEDEDNMLSIDSGDDRKSKTLPMSTMVQVYQLEVDKYRVCYLSRGHKERCEYDTVGLPSVKEVVNLVNFVPIESIVINGDESINCVNFKKMGKFKVKNDVNNICKWENQPTDRKFRCENCEEIQLASEMTSVWGHNANESILCKYCFDVYLNWLGDRINKM